MRGAADDMADGLERVSWEGQRDTMYGRGEDAAMGEDRLLLTKCVCANGWDFEKLRTVLDRRPRSDSVALPIPLPTVSSMSVGLHCDL